MTTGTEREVYIPWKLDPSCVGRIPATDTLRRLSGETMGTEWTLSAYLPESCPVRKVDHLLEGVFERICQSMSPWLEGSEIYCFNRLAPGLSVSVSDDFAHVLEGALDVAAASDGAFDPTLAGERDRLGFGPSRPCPLKGSSCRELITTPSRKWESVSYDSRTRRLVQDGSTHLDFCAIAKGYAVDRVAEGLIAIGCHSFVFEIGGEFTARGLKADGQPWWCLLEGSAPLEGRESVLALHNCSLAASGNWRRQRQVNGVSYGHILSQSGRTLNQSAETVFVLHRKCMLADAWATAIAAAGLEEGMALARRNGIASLSIAPVTREAHTSPAWEDLVEGG